MIATLIAHEARTTRGMLAATAGWLLLVAAGSFAAALLRVPFLSPFAFTIGMIAVGLLAPAAVALLAVRYWKSMYGAEGYFTMLIPVRGRALCGAKVLYASIVTIVALIVTLGGFAVAAMVDGLTRGLAPADTFSQLWRSLAGIDPLLVWLGVAAFFVQAIVLIVQGASVMTIGAGARFNHLGIGAPLIGGVVLYLVTQLTSFVAMLFIPLGVRLTGPDAGRFVAEGMWRDVVALLENPGASPDPSVIGLGMIVPIAVLTVVLAFWAVRSVERHTSLR